MDQSAKSPRNWGKSPEQKKKQKFPKLSGTESLIANRMLPKIAGLNRQKFRSEKQKNESNRNKVESRKIDSESPSESHPINAYAATLESHDSQIARFSIRNRRFSATKAPKSTKGRTSPDRKPPPFATPPSSGPSTNAVPMNASILSQKKKQSEQIKIVCVRPSHT